MKYLLVAAVIALVAFAGAAPASAQTTNGVEVPGSVRTPTYHGSGSYVFSDAKGEDNSLTKGNRCYVRECGMPSHGDCDIWCAENETPVCSCDCTNRVLGVCSELRGFCSCQRKRLSWWERNFGGD